MSNKVLQISAEDAKYIDPTQISSLQMTDGTMIYVQGNEQEGEFVEEAQDGQQYQTQEVQDGQNQKLRGRGLGALAGLAAGAALLGTAAAVGGAMRRPYRGPMMGPPMMGPPMRPPMMRPPMMGPPMMRPYY